MAPKSPSSVLSGLQKLVPGDDHWVTLAIATAAIAVLGVTTELQLYWLLTIGMLVSGIVEIALRAS